MLNESFSLPPDPCNKMKSVKFEELLGFIFVQGLLGVHTKQHKTVSAFTEIYCTITLCTIWPCGILGLTIIVQSACDPKWFPEYCVCACVCMGKNRVWQYLFSNCPALWLVLQHSYKSCIVFCAHIASSVFILISFISSKMINFSVPDTIDERTINKKKLTPFTIQVQDSLLFPLGCFDLIT